MKGQSFLALVFLIGSIMLIAGVALAFVTISFINSSYGFRAAQVAETAAISGAEDAVMQLTRDSTFSNTSGYSLAVGSTTATVTVTQNSPSTGYVAVLSTATVSNRTRKISAVLSVNSSTGQAYLVSWQAIQ